jgi:uncharacterized membrane protein
MEEDDENLTLAEKLADLIAKFGGSWYFILTFISFMLIWVVVNILLVEPFDPYPFILLNLLLSCLAALQAPVIMMSQNRQEAKDRKRAEADHFLNIKVEQEIIELTEHVKALHQHLDNTKHEFPKKTFDNHNPTGI